MKIVIPALVIAAALALTGCTADLSTAAEKDSALTNGQLNTYSANQPIPKSNWSQYRQTIIDTELAQIHGVATTTFFFNMGSNIPLKTCPSIGFPVASTAQLTSPDQATGSYSAPAVVSQQEPNGVYTGVSSGTYVVCVSADGKKRINYWEGSVETEGGAAHFDTKTMQIVDYGGSTVVTVTK